MKSGLLLSIIFLISLTSYSQKVNRWSSEEKAVLEIVDLFFEGMANRDTALLNSIMTPEGRYYGIHETNGDWTEHTASHERFIDGLTKETDLIQERIWNPEIKVHKTIAMVWAPYDIYANGKFMHCGIDAFSLIKTNEEWKIAGTVFTMEPEGCEESPLGPIKGE